VASAMRLVRRKNWARQTGNDGVVRILVPLPAAGDRKQRKALLRGTTGADKHAVRGERSRTSNRTSGPDKRRTIEALENAIVTLREQLARSEGRADKLQAELTEERRRLIAILTGPARVPWWRRLFRW
jgi:hypothetical protein